jgi:hypothetical protein
MARPTMVVIGVLRAKDSLSHQRLALFARSPRIGEAQYRQLYSAA